MLGHLAGPAYSPMSTTENNPENPTMDGRNNIVFSMNIQKEMYLSKMFKMPIFSVD